MTLFYTFNHIRAKAKIHNLAASLLNIVEESRPEGVPPAHETVVSRLGEGLLEDTVVVQFLDRIEVWIALSLVEPVKLRFGYLLLRLRPHDIGDAGALGKETLGLVDDMVGQAAFKRLS